MIEKPVYRLCGVTFYQGLVDRVLVCKMKIGETVYEILSLTSYWASETLVSGILQVLLWGCSAHTDMTTYRSKVTVRGIRDMSGLFLQALPV